MRVCIMTSPVQLSRSLCIYMHNLHASNIAQTSCNRLADDVKVSDCACKPAGKENVPKAVEDDENAEDDADVDEAADQAVEKALTETAKAPSRAAVGKKRKAGGASKV